MFLNTRVDIDEGLNAYCCLGQQYEEFDHRPLRDFEIYVFNPLYFRQSAVLYDAVIPVGFISWAWLNREEESRFIRSESQLGDFMYRSEEDVPWVLDMIVDKTKRSTSLMVRELRKFFSTDAEFDGFDYLRALRSNGRLAKFRRLKDAAS